MTACFGTTTRSFDSTLPGSGIVILSHTTLIRAAFTLQRMLSRLLSVDTMSREKVSDVNDFITCNERDGYDWVWR